jgi:hypothetical protein
VREDLLLKQPLHKYLVVLVDAAVLTNGNRRVGDFKVLLVALREKPDLRVKAPALAVGVVVVEVGVLGDQLVVGLPAELFGQNPHQGALANSNVAGDRDVLAPGRVCVLHRTVLLVPQADDRIIQRAAGPLRYELRKIIFNSKLKTQNS